MHPTDTTDPLYRTSYSASDFSSIYATVSPGRCNLFVQALVAYINQLFGGDMALKAGQLLQRHPDLATYLVTIVLHRSAASFPAPLFPHHLITSETSETWSYLESLVMSIKRTNLVSSKPDKTTEDGLTAIAFKLSPKHLAHMPQGSLPWSEVFVFHDTVEGVLMRGSPIARGGVRWSDRQDYRQELYHLWQTQMLKNSIVVPSGGKGAFKIRGDHDPRQAYRLFISALLDVTDMHPSKDPESDSYLVVAPDKGTAHFLDEANTLAHDRGYWLDDAFASGSSTGYDHKKMAITSRGVWISIRHHQEALGITGPLRCIGVGDMSGDVFGNGILLDEDLLLMGAFNHHHIFLEPSPTAGLRDELKRLFTLEHDWSHFNPRYLSDQGGIFLRSASSLPLSPGMKKLLDTDKTHLPPEAVIQLLLKAKVDLLFFGGIGTYVKASHETHAMIEDPLNDPLRIDADHLRAKMIGEGANVAMTQAARIQFTHAGGYLNTDALDNSGGVDCSDHEVNLKILLMRPLRQGRIDLAQRAQLIASLEPDVQRSVLRHNKDQNECLSRISPFEQYSEHLKFLDFLLTGSDRIQWQDHLTHKAALKALSRPELCVLLAQSKNHLSESFFASSFFTSDEIPLFIARYFSTSLHESFQDDMSHHPLARHIAITEATNLVMDRFGPTLLWSLSQHLNIPYAACAIQGLALLAVLRLWEDPWGHLPLVQRTALWRMLLEGLRNPDLWHLEGEITYSACVLAYAKDYAKLAEAYRNLGESESPSLSSSQGFVRLWHLCQGLAFLKARRFQKKNDVSISELAQWLKSSGINGERVLHIHKALHGLPCRSAQDVLHKRFILSYLSATEPHDGYSLYATLEVALGSALEFACSPAALAKELAWETLARSLQEN